MLAVPELARMDVGLCAEPVFSLRPVHLGFVVGRVARRQGFLRILPLSPINVVLPVLVHLSAIDIVYSIISLTNFNAQFFIR